MSRRTAAIPASVWYTETLLLRVSSVGRTLLFDAHNTLPEGYRASSVFEWRVVNRQGVRRR